MLEVNVDHHRESLAHEFGLGFEMEESKEVGERIERRRAEKDGERPSRGPYDGAGDKVTTEDLHSIRYTSSPVRLFTDHSTLILRSLTGLINI